MRYTWTAPSKSTDGQHYRVTGRIAPTGLNMTCDCPAGVRGNWCWHRLYIGAKHEAYKKLTDEEMKRVRAWEAYGLATVTITEEGY